MEIKTISELKEFLEVIDNLNPDGRIYRGVCSAEYKLIPKVGRLLSIFKQRAVDQISFQPASELEWLAVRGQ